MSSSYRAKTPRAVPVPTSPPASGVWRHRSREEHDDVHDGDSDSACCHPPGATRGEVVLVTVARSSQDASRTPPVIVCDGRPVAELRRRPLHLSLDIGGHVLTARAGWMSSAPVHLDLTVDAAAHALPGPTEPGIVVVAGLTPAALLPQPFLPSRAVSLTVVTDPATNAEIVADQPSAIPERAGLCPVSGAGLRTASHGVTTTKE